MGILYQQLKVWHQLIPLEKVLVCVVCSSGQQINLCRFPEPPKDLPLIEAQIHYHILYNEQHLSNIYYRAGIIQGFPGGLSGKESTCQCRRRRGHGFDPWVRKTLRQGNSNPLQYFCLENPMDREAWWVAKSHNTTEQLSMYTLGHYTNALHIPCHKNLLS